MHTIELRHLRCLVAIADEGSFSRAAMRLGTTQPAVSQLLKRLEDLAGHRLVKRNRSSVCFTAMGEEVLLQARQALLAVDRALAATERSLRGETGRLRLGLSAPSLYGGIPALIRRFRAERPGVALEISIVPSTSQPAALLADHVDVTFGTFEHRQDAVTQHILGEEAMRIVLPRWHRLSGMERISLSDLRDDAWILPPRDTPLAEEMFGHCRKAGFIPKAAAESPDFSTTFGLVLADTGVALAAESFRDFAGPDLILIPVEGPEPRLRHYMTYRTGETAPTVTAFLARARQ